MAKKSTPKPKGGKGGNGGCKPKLALVSLIIIMIIGMMPAMATTNLMNPNLINWATSITGSATFTGTVTGGATTNTGTINHWAMMGANLPFTMAVGTGAFDLSNSTGDLHGTTGIEYLNAVKSATVRTTGAGTFASIVNNGTQTQTGVESFTVGPLFNAGFILPANQGISITSGTSIIDLSGGSGIFKTTTGAVTLGPGAVSHTGTVAYSVNAVINADTTITASSTKTTYEIDASGADVTLTLPDAATVSGRLYYVAIKTDPGAFFARIKTTAGKLGGASGIAAVTGLKNTDAAGGITLVSDGTDYLIVGQYFPVGGVGFISG